MTVTATIALPITYVIATFVLGLNRKIIAVGKLLGVGRYGEWFLEDSWPLSLEYLLLTFFFTASIHSMYGIKGVKQFLASLFFLGATGTFYMIDTFYPYGTVIVLQSFVPFIAYSTTLVLGWMNYGTLLLSGPEGAVHMLVAGPHGGAHWYLYWPSAGVHSFIIYTLVTLLFIKNSRFSSQRKIIYASIPRRLKFIAKKNKASFLLEHKPIDTAITTAETFFVNFLRMIPLYAIVVIGAVGTFIANILRIVSICTIGSKAGSEAAQLFHSYHGELYFITWVIIYVIALLLLSHKVWKGCLSSESRPPLRDVHKNGEELHLQAIQKCHLCSSSRHAPKGNACMHLL